MAQEELVDAFYLALANYGRFQVLTISHGFSMQYNVMYSVK